MVRWTAPCCESIFPECFSDMMRFSPFMAVIAAALLLSACSTTRKTTTSGGDAVTQASVKTPLQAEENRFDPNEASQYTADRYQSSSTREHDLIHTELAVSFDWSKSRMNGEAILTLEPYFYATDQVILDAKGFDWHRVELLQEDGSAEILPYEYNNWQIDIQLPREFAGGETYRLRLLYTAKPEELPEGGSSAITSDKGLYIHQSPRRRPRQAHPAVDSRGDRSEFLLVPHHRQTQ